MIPARACARRCMAGWAAGEGRTCRFLSMGAALPLIFRHSVRFQMLIRFAICRVNKRLRQRRGKVGVGRCAALAMAEAVLTRTPSSPSSMSVAIMHVSSGSSQKTGAAVTAVVVVRTRRRAAGFLRPQLQIISAGSDCRRAGAPSQRKDQHVGAAVAPHYRSARIAVSLRLRSLAATFHLIYGQPRFCILCLRGLQKHPQTSLST